MPRGRKGLSLIAPERVDAAFRRWWPWQSNHFIAAQWQVSERTIRRWRRRGLPLWYGIVWIERSEWDAFDRTGRVSRKGLMPGQIGAHLVKASIAARYRARAAENEKVSVSPGHAATFAWPARPVGGFR